MAAERHASHRPGAFKQQNKTHKHGKHQSKGQLEKDKKGRVNVKVFSKKVKLSQKRVDRRNHAQQIRRQKKEDALAWKRARGAIGSPRLVAIVSLCQGVYARDVLAVLKSGDDTALCTDNDEGMIHMNVPRFKQRYSFICPDYADLHAVLDAAKVADLLLLVISPEFGVDSYGDYCLSCLTHQGMPAALTIVQDLKTLPVKKQSETRKMLQKSIDRRCPRSKLHTLDSEQDALIVLRQIGSQKLTPILLRDYRPHLIAEGMTFHPNDSQSSEGTLKVTGYVRGRALDVNGLVHITGLGDFQMSQIDAPSDPYRQKLQANNQDVDMTGEVKVLMKAVPTQQTSLDCEVIPDPMEGEQTWPTEEELQEADDNFKKKKVVKRVPKGTSDYQAEWIIDSGDEEDDTESENDEDDEMAAVSGDESEAETASLAPTEDMDTVTFGDTDQYDAAFDVDVELAMLAKYKEARIDGMFPDEVDTPQDVPAKQRFERYRGLKSFRTSPWDPKENLPSDYARIYQFESYRNTRNRTVKQESIEGVLPGWYVTVHVKNVPRSFVDNRARGSPVVLFGLLPHEHRISVMNLALRRTPGYDEPIRSKERLVFQVGYRRFTACPAFSQHTNSDKHKFERFLREDVVTVATMYAPIVFSPASVLVFKERANGSHCLVATGSLLSMDPNRVVCKRLVLSGHPFKINRKHAVVRYMFFNREDINWFKPVELRTKCGRRGHIKEPLGTHGHMKCTFDGQLKSMDTVLMHLYKRVYPKWTYDPSVPRPPQVTDDTMDTDAVDALF